jgi:hypothetical protein
VISVNVNVLNRKIIIGVFCLFLALVVYEVGWAPPLSTSKLNKISVGMTTNQVEQLLGSPTVDTRSAANNPPKPFNFYWYYERPFHWQHVWIYFDEQQRVSQYKVNSVDQ